MDNKLRKQIVANTKKQIKALTKQLEQDAIAKIDKALNSGALSEHSDFLKLDGNQLLARCILENEFENYRINYSDYKKEADNVKFFI